MLNVKALVGTFNQEKALVGAFSMIVKTDFETDGSSAALILAVCSSAAIHQPSQAQYSRFDLDTF